MDLINNLIFTALNSVPDVADSVGPPLKPRFIKTPFTPKPEPLEQSPKGEAPYFSYDLPVIKKFCAIEDSEFVEDAIQKHWADFVNHVPNDPAAENNRNYQKVATVTTIYSNFENPPYHLIYAYLVENTRIAQIMEKLVFMYLHDEKLNKASSVDTELAFQWIANTENLFFKSLRNTSYRNVISQVRVSQDATRRNAYFRMFGMDLAFGDLVSNGPVNFHKADSNNQSFIVLFEKFLSEIWQAYVNARNTSGANTTDLFEIVDLARKIQEMLMSRRTTDTVFKNDRYRFWNLSREEYASVVMMSWFYEIVSYNSPIVEFLRCTANTPGERLINIGNKVGLPAHSKSEGLLDIAPLMNTLLRRIELGDYNEQGPVDLIIKSEKDNKLPPDPDRLALNDLLEIINNWEKATGHKIKGQEAGLNGTVRVDQKVPRPTLALN
jgi:hypothetical protein